MFERLELKPDVKIGQEDDETQINLKVKFREQKEIYENPIPEQR